MTAARADIVFETVDEREPAVCPVGNPQRAADIGRRELAPETGTTPFHELEAVGVVPTKN